MARKLEGKVAVVTGGSKGIGASICKSLAHEGASVVVNYSSSKQSADNIVNAIKRDGSKAIAVQASVTKPDDIAHLFNETQKAFDKLDILVNNAGIYEFAPIAEVTPEFFYKSFNINVLAVLLVTKEALKLFGNSGSIVNISSIVSRLAFADSSVYSGSKAAVDAITRVLAAELGPRHIRVNAVNPGMVETEGTHAQGIIESDLRKKVEATTPLGRIGQPQDIASAVTFLASDDASWITGETLFIAGGFR